MKKSIKTTVKEALINGIAVRETGSINISALSREVGKSIPIVKKIIDELCDDGFVKNNIWNYAVFEKCIPTAMEKINRLEHLLKSGQYLKHNGRQNITTLAKKLNVGRETLYRYIEIINDRTNKDKE